MNPLEEAIRDAVTFDGSFAAWARFADIRPGQWIELQALGDRNYYVHTNDLQQVAVLQSHGMVRQAATGLYIIANQIDEAVTSRAEPHKWHFAKRNTSTSNRDIVSRSVVFIDIDAERPSGTSATDQEMACATEQALAIYDKLASVIGDSDCLGYGHSGNGRQVFIALDHIAESPELAATIRQLLLAVASWPCVPGAKVDVGVHDAKRLVPLFGTMKCKGVAGLAERPHRATAFVCSESVRRFGFDELQALLGKLSVRRQVAQPARGHSGGLYQRANEAPIHEVAEWLGLVEGEHIRCPGCSNLEGNGTVGNGFKCFHNTCQSKGAPNHGGFRTPVDLVVEARGVSPRQAAALIAERFGMELRPARELRATGPASAAETGAGPTQPAAVTSAGPSQPAAVTSAGPSQPAAETSAGPSQPAAVTGAGPSQPARDEREPAAPASQFGSPQYIADVLDAEVVGNPGLVMPKGFLLEQWFDNKNEVSLLRERCTEGKVKSCDACGQANALDASACDCGAPLPEEAPMQIKRWPLSRVAVWLATELVRPPDEGNLLEFAAIVDERKRSFVLPRSLIHDARKLIQAIEGAGVPLVTSKSLPYDMADYVSAFLFANRRYLPRRNARSSTGWDARRTSFLFGTEAIGWGSDQLYLPPGTGVHNMLAAITRRGKPEVWKSAATDMISDSPVGAVVLAAAVASPMLRLFGWAPIGVILSSEGGGGKSTIIRLGL
ncbi:MAG: DUF927 domain-containing protein, partial [Polyangiaceae bacterium]|nr:DUF927 domain-containing protein [Polyangiaceae bacterium]